MEVRGQGSAAVLLLLPLRRRWGWNSGPSIWAASAITRWPVLLAPCSPPLFFLSQGLLELRIISDLELFMFMPLNMLETPACGPVRSFIHSFIHSFRSVVRKDPRTLSMLSRHSSMESRAQPCFSLIRTFTVTIRMHPGFAPYPPSSL